MKVIDRKKAAEILSVSIRTVDRYIQKGTLEKEVINGRIFINPKSFGKLQEQKIRQDEYLSEINAISPPLKTIDRGEAQEASETSIVAEYTEEGAAISENRRKTEVYKNLYEELQEELKIKQERLEGANYRVGQLEGKLKETVPLLEYRKALALEQKKRDELEDILTAFEKDNERLNQTVESKQTEVTQISDKLETERFNKKIFIIILVVLFLLQPLWLILPT
jgi:chromosome segregation ATPase